MKSPRKTTHTRISRTLNDLVKKLADIDNTTIFEYIEKAIVEYIRLYAAGKIGNGYIDLLILYQNRQKAFIPKFKSKE